MSYSLRQVSWAIAVFYAVLIIFDIRGIHNWSKTLDASAASQFIKNETEQYWRVFSDLRLDRPKIWIESKFLDFQDAHASSYPQSYEDFIASRKKRELRREQLKVQKSIQAVENALMASRSRTEKTKISASHVSQAQRRNILLIGDSIMAGIGPSIKKEIIDRIDGSVSLHAQVATGLARPDVFDWQQELEILLSGEKFDTVIMMLGTNDNQDFFEQGNILSYGTPDWVKAYNTRLANLMHTACTQSKQAIWMSLPPMRSESFNRKVIRINNWAKRQSKKYPCMTYLDIDRVIGDSDGNFTSYQKIGDGMEKVRMVDGIHVTPSGGKLIAEHLIRVIANLHNVSAIQSTREKIAN